MFDSVLFFAKFYNKRPQTRDMDSSVRIRSFVHSNNFDRFKSAIIQSNLKDYKSTWSWECVLDYGSNCQHFFDYSKTPTRKIFYKKLNHLYKRI